MVLYQPRKCKCGEEFYPTKDNEYLCEDCREEDDTLARKDFVYRKWKEKHEEE